MSDNTITKYEQKHFIWLQYANLYNSSDEDQISLLFIYLPIVRAKFSHFVHLWNNHKIRHQPNRPNLPTGQPHYNYFYPPDGISDYGNKPSRSKLNELKLKLEGYGK